MREHSPIEATSGAAAQPNRPGVGAPTNGGTKQVVLRTPDGTKQVVCERRVARNSWFAYAGWRETVGLRMPGGTKQWVCVCRVARNRWVSWSGAGAPDRLAAIGARSAPGIGTSIGPVRQRVRV
ncbi:hypothetical protein GCM10009083_17250 [Halopseudomonas pertucinogena]|uniref:Uncharacterized protein n=1 Tax=Halopseudomonas pertucinogena TaxID=86175 RepID=A0ABQ2CPR1_9GAMM|nr:hypothetical protein GCM10009083_17250 [Halopseudomonas pertucinogena]